MTDFFRQESLVTLRVPTESDRAAFVLLRRSSADHLRGWEPAMEDDELQFGTPSFDRQLAGCESESDQPFLICRATDGVIVGSVGLGQIYRGPFCSCYMGYWIGQPFIRQGYGAAGVLACLARAFAPLDAGGVGLHRVEANIIPRNTASLALVRRVGFRKEGFSPRYLKVAGQWQDHERWAITAEDWAQCTDGKRRTV